MLPYAQTHPIPRVPLPEARSWSEADLAAHKLTVVRLETVPPEVPRFPVGTWAIMPSTLWDGSGWLWHLEVVALRDLWYPSGDPYDRTSWDWVSDTRTMAVEKYVAWIKAGVEPPPLEVSYTPKGRLRVDDGHSRAAALVAVGRDTALAWVSPTREISEKYWGALTHRQAVQEALREGKAVPEEVLAEYPDLAATDGANP